MIFSPGKQIISSWYRCYPAVRYQWKVDNFCDNIFQISLDFCLPSIKSRNKPPFQPSAAASMTCFFFPHAVFPSFLACTVICLREFLFTSTWLKHAPFPWFSLSSLQVQSRQVFWPLEFSCFSLTYLPSPGFTEHHFLYISTDIPHYCVHPAWSWLFFKHAPQEPWDVCFASLEWSPSLSWNLMLHLCL